jgi:hypothetical protein
MEALQPARLQGAEARVQQGAEMIFAGIPRVSGQRQGLVDLVHPSGPREGLAGPVRRNSQLRGRDRVLRPDQPQPPCSKVSSSEGAEGRSRVWAAAAMPG